MKTILRFEKIKTFEALNLSNAHINRYMETPNADTKIRNKKIFGSGNVVKDVKERLNKNGIKPRKNAVLCMEALLTLSPEYFTSKEATKNFTIAAAKWLSDEYGENVLSVDLHLDESTPHIHAIILPITEDGRLSARDLFNKLTLKKFQKSYCDLMSEKTGIDFDYKEGSKAKHQNVKEYYTKINKELPALKENDDLKAKVENLENELDEKEDENYQLNGKIKKLEKDISIQNEEISQLKSFIEKLTKKFN
ncbi:hypothetical protein C9J48_20430, partial [Photobacterium profundum]